MNPVPLDELLEHAPWVRRLATQLVRDAAAADDLAQEVWLTAMRGAPSSLRNPRAWLASVARSLAFTDARSRRRRAAREALRGPGQDAPPADQVVAEAELERDVAARVLALPEPYRTVVLMRFYRDQSPAEIARTLGRPVATVKVQLQRGLDKLRADLEREHGGSSKWCVMLAPLLVRRPPDAALATSIAAWAVLLGASLWLWSRSQEPSPHAAPLEVAGARPPAEFEELDAELELRASDDRREAEVSPQPTTPGSTTAAKARWRERERVELRGRLLGLDGAPLAYVPLELEDPGRLRLADRAHSALVADSFWLSTPRELRDPATLDRAQLESFLAEHFEDPADARALLSGLELAPESVRTDAGGEFVLLARSQLARPAARGPGLRVIGTLSEARTDVLATQVWLAAATRRLVVRCVSADGAPLANLRVELAAQLERESFTPLSSSATSDENGELVFEQAPACELRLSAPSQLGEVEAQYAPPPAEAPWTVVFVGPRAAPARILAGRALRPDGEPARFAEVFFSNGRARAQADGSFELSFSDTADIERLVLVEPGFDPLVLEQLASRFAVHAPRWEIGSLTLPASHNVLAGVLLDAAGAPVAHGFVSLSDPTRARAASGADSIEAVAGGYLLGGVRTDQHGRFELRGLLPREYELSFQVDGAWMRAGPFEPPARDLVLRPQRD